MILPDTVRPDHRAVLGGVRSSGCAAGAGVRGVRSAADAAPTDVPVVPVARRAVGRDVGAGDGVVLRRAPPAAVGRPTARLPYAVLVVTLDDDPSIRLVGDTAAGVAVSSIAIGSPVSVVFEDAGEGVVAAPVAAVNLVSADAHVLEPPHIWSTWLPAAYQDRAPTLVQGCRRG